MYRLKSDVSDKDLLRIGFEAFSDGIQFIYGDGVIVNIETKEVEVPPYCDDENEVAEVVNAIYLLAKNDLI